MKNIGINHAVHGEFKRRQSRLFSEVAGVFYDNFVPAAVDVLPISKRTSQRSVLLGLRRSEPVNWWTIGRMIKPGEEPAKTAGNVLSEEFGINANPDDFRLVCINSSVFSLRKQPPKENGRHVLTIVFALEVDEDEPKFSLPQTGKYRETRWFSTSEIISGDFYPTIKSMVKMVK